MNKARQSNYNIELHYINTDNFQLAIDRVSNRVADGGHGMPEKDIIRRFKRSHENLPKAIIKPNKTIFHDNSSPENSHETVANFTHDEYRLLKNAPDWAKDAIAQVLNAPRTGLNDDIHENPFKTPSDSEKEIGPEPNIPC